ncbi:MAG: DNA polymerase III subunit gamma/tau [Verrucomicrobiae bacterium]|nr:DNA polymerase III subunit gamma/tau [Verrucomicrobiae bacterium]
MAQYQVLARKWRPQQFDQIVGQEHITQTLVNAIKNKRIAHAYLLVGPRGTGKTTTARIFAKALNCEKGPRPEPCDKCDSCREIAAGSSMNVLEYDAASNTQVDKIRELIIENVKYAPTRGHYKIYIVDEVHMLSTASFNALLKTLEEPPEHVIFVFATTEVAKVPMTILSRCQRFDFRRLSSSQIVKQLAKMAKEEKVQIEEPALLAIARGAEGCMRDAQSTLDQLISFCGNKIAEDDVLAMFGLASRAQIVELADDILAGRTDGALRRFNELAEAGKDLQRLLTELIEHFRNLLVVRMAGQQAAALDVTDAELADLKKQAATTDVDALLRIMDVLTGAEARVRFSASRRILFEVTLIKAVLAREAVGIDVVLQKLNALRGGPAPPSPGGAAPSAESAKSVSAYSARPAAPPSRVQETSDALREIWDYVHEHFGQAAPLAREYLNQSRPISFDGQTLVIGFDPEFKPAMDFLQGPRYLTVLQTKLREAVGHDVALRFQLVEDPDLGTKRPDPASEDPAARAQHALTANLGDVRNDPVIKQALEIFRGQILEVRA